MSNHLLRAERIGSEIPHVSLAYCSDDNTYTETPGLIRAWACPMEAKPEYAYLGSVTTESGDLFTLMFG